MPGQEPVGHVIPYLTGTVLHMLVIFACRDVARFHNAMLDLRWHYMESKWSVLCNAKYLPVTIVYKSDGNQDSYCEDKQNDCEIFSLVEALCESIFYTHYGLLDANIDNGSLAHLGSVLIFFFAALWQIQNLITPPSRLYSPTIGNIAAQHWQNVMEYIYFIWNWFTCHRVT